MTLVFVRHGQAQSNATGVIGGWRDYPLTDLGREQARAAAWLDQRLLPPLTRA